MRASSVFYASSLFAFITSTSAYVLPSSSSLYQSNSSAEKSCEYLRQSLTQPCWDQLNVTGYLTEWWKIHEPDCRASNTGFATCYQQLTGISQQQCAHTGPSMCDFPDDLSAFAPQEAYVLYTIFAIWQWFQSLYDAIINADVSAQGPIGQIIKAINPVKPSTEALGSFFQALTALTPMIALPAAIGQVSIGLLARTIETALRQSPGVMKQLYPSGTLNSEYDQQNDIYAALAHIKTSYQANISTALSLVQDDFRTFSLFASEGSFIAPRSDLQVQSTSLTKALTTAVVAQGLTLNNIIITLARDTSPYELAHNGSLTSPDLIQCDSYDSYGVCSTWWYDAVHNDAYALASVSDSDTNFYDLLQTIFDNGWTTGEELFRGARECADYAVSQSTSAEIPSLDINTFSARCLSNTQVCVYDQHCAYNDQKCLYTGEYGWGDGGGSCRPPADYLRAGCGDGAGAGYTIGTRVPAAYLGPMVRDGGVERTYCHS